MAAYFLRPARAHWRAVLLATTKRILTFLTVFLRSTNKTWVYWLESENGRATTSVILTFLQPTINTFPNGLDINNFENPGIILWLCFLILWRGWRCFSGGLLFVLLWGFWTWPNWVRDKLLYDDALAELVYFCFQNALLDGLDDIALDVVLRDMENLWDLLVAHDFDVAEDSGDSLNFNSSFQFLLGYCFCL